MSLHIPANGVPTLYFHDDHPKATGDCATCEHNDNYRAMWDGYPCDAPYEHADEQRAVVAIRRWENGGEAGRCPLYEGWWRLDLTPFDWCMVDAGLMEDFANEEPVPCPWASGALFVRWEVGR